MRLTALVVVACVAAYAPSPRRLACPSVRVGPAAAAATSMHAAPPATVAQLWRYPIKGFPPDSLADVTVEENGTFPFDRQWAVTEATDDTFDASAPKWVHKQHFFGAFRSRPQLASLNTSFEGGLLRFMGDDETGEAQLFTETGRELIERAIGRRVGGAVKLVTGGERHQFGNTQSGVRHHNDTRTLHVVNAASVRVVAAATGLDVDAAVFRPNIVLEGLPAWAEEGWVGKTLVLGGVALEVISRTVRCDAQGRIHSCAAMPWRRRGGGVAAAS